MPLASPRQSLLSDRSLSGDGFLCQAVFFTPFSLPASVFPLGSPAYSFHQPCSVGQLGKCTESIQCMCPSHIHHHLFNFVIKSIGIHFRTGDTDWMFSYPFFLLCGCWSDCVKMCTLWDAVSLVFPRSMMPVTSPCSVLNRTAVGSAGLAVISSAWTVWWCGAQRGEATCINYRQSETPFLSSFPFIQVFL